MPERFDAIVVGARCAGSPLATWLARAGLRVCLLDRARFPSDSPSTHGIQPIGVAVLRRLGVLDELLQRSTAIDRATFALDDARVEVDGITALVGAPMLNVRRITLDAVLLEAAAAAGADVRTATAVTGLVEERGRVVGVRTRAGSLRAPVVVGADGVRSFVARGVGAVEYRPTAAARIFMWSYFEAVDCDRERVLLGKVDDVAYLASPTDAGLFMAAVAPSAERRGELLADRERGYVSALAGWPELDALLAGSRRVGAVRAMSRWHGYFRASAGPGWALVGDAGHFKDPTPGQGIADALRQGVELAAAIERGLAVGDLDRRLHDWWRWRDRDAWEMYRFAQTMGAAGETPLLVREIQRRIAADRRLTEGLARVLNHELAPARLFTPRLVLGATAAALLRERGRRRRLLREARDLAVDELRHLRRPRPRSEGGIAAPEPTMADGKRRTTGSGGARRPVRSEGASSARPPDPPAGAGEHAA